MTKWCAARANGRLHDKDAAALRAKGFEVHPGNLVEWHALLDAPELMIGW
jgi:hypothetical protein